MFHNDSNIKKGKTSLCRRLYSFIQLYDASLWLSSFAAFEPPSKKCQATSFSSKYKLDIAWSQATVFCQVKMTLNSHFSVFFVMFTQSLRALKRPLVSLTRLDSVNQWMCPDVFWGIPNFLHDFKVLPQCTYVPKFGCPNP